MKLTGNKRKEFNGAIHYSNPTYRCIVGEYPDEVKHDKKLFQEIKKEILMDVQPLVKPIVVKPVTRCKKPNYLQVLVGLTLTGLLIAAIAYGYLYY